MGPVNSIILDRKIDFEEIQQVDDFLNSVVNGKVEITKSTRDFWIDSKKLLKICEVGSDCQFSIQFDNKLREIDEDEIVEIEMLTSKTIKSQIVISAGCNQDGDHNVLGELTLEIAKLLNGLVDFGGDLNIYGKGVTEELKGKVYSIEYNNGMAEYQIADVEFLTNWIKHPNFRMIK